MRFVSGGRAFKTRAAPRSFAMPTAARWIGRGLCLAGVVCLVGCDQPTPTFGAGMRADGGGPKPLAASSESAVSQAAEDFIAKTVGADLYQLEAAKIAAAKAHAPGVKAFAQSMAEEHATSRALLNAAARSSGQAVPIPTEPTERQQSMLHLLVRGEQSDFDRTYMEQQVQTHEDTLILVNAYAQSGGVPAIRRVAAGLSPDLQQDLKKAQALESALDRP